MRAMLLPRAGARLEAADVPVPQPGPGQLLLRIRACAVCRTDLHLVDGELTGLHPPRIPGHEIVGQAVAAGPGVELPQAARLGLPWLGWTCGICEQCRAGRENLCDSARFTGWQVDGGYAEYVLADHRYCLPIPDRFGDAEAAPLLCAGLIGHRALAAAGAPGRLGLFGFGAAAHIVAQLARHEGREVYAFVRPGDEAAASFARGLGCVWAGPSDRPAPVQLDAAILFAPVGALVPMALAAVRKGGRVVCAGIYMSDIPAFPYALLWGERSLCSVANLTRRDGQEFMNLAGRVPLQTYVEVLPLESANEALDRLRRGDVRGALVLVP
ncbi:MAG: zinc-dependent alcohol dehydrogenase family protein [Steroidobacteraceae bacterium]